MAGSGRQLAADDVLALRLAHGDTIKVAAAAAGVSEATVYRRLRTREFSKRIVDLRANIIAEAVGRLAATMGQAADALRQLLTSESERVRLDTAKAIIDLGAKLWDQTDILPRLKAIEDEMEAERGK